MLEGAQWLSGRVLYSRPRGGRLEPHWCHCVVSLGNRHFLESDFGNSVILWSVKWNIIFCQHLALSPKNDTKF